MSQSGNESERQSKIQKLLSPDPESLHGQIPDLPPNADERGKLIWHWDDSDDDEFEDFPPGKVYFAIEENYNARMTAKKELSEIRARRSSLKERKNTIYEEQRRIHSGVNGLLEAMETTLDTPWSCW